MPRPRANEEHDDFINRCIPDVIEEGSAENGSQARALCERIWEDPTIVDSEANTMADDTKALKPARIKQMDERGHGTAVFATFGVVDSDGDITEPGAFGEQHVKILPTHDWSSVPLGKGITREEGDQALVDFQLNLDTQAGRDWHSALRFDLEHGQPLQEWSYGFSIKEADHETREGQAVQVLRALNVHEVSPVVLGAGMGTGTVAIKSDKRAVGTHTTKTSSAPWDGPRNERRVLEEQSASYYQGIYAWRDPEGQTGNKTAWRFLHHFVDDDGNAGAASIRAARTGIAVLNGARGGTTIPEADRKGVYRHLAQHLRDAGEEVPDLRSYDECAMKLSDQITFATWDAETALERARQVKKLSDDRIGELNELETVVEHLYQVAKELETEMKQVNDHGRTERLLGDYLYSKAVLDGHVGTVSQQPDHKEHMRFCVVDGKRIKGENLASLLENAIEDMVTDDRSRSDIVEEIAQEANLTSSTINQILNGGINCPTARPVNAFASLVRGVSRDDIINAMQRDGCEGEPQDTRPPGER